jgi:hypothetical protein
MIFFTLRPFAAAVHQAKWPARRSEMEEALLQERTGRCSCESCVRLDSERIVIRRFLTGPGYLQPIHL